MRELMHRIYDRYQHPEGPTALQPLTLRAPKFLDLFKNEEWWDRYRNRACAILVGDEGVVTQLFDAFGQSRFLFLGRRDQVQQAIGDTAAGRKHHAEPGMRVLLQNAGHALHASRIGDTRAAEFMYAPALHL